MIKYKKNSFAPQIIEKCLKPQAKRLFVFTLDTFNLLESVAVQTVTPEEQNLRTYQRFLIARKQSLKKINNIKAAIRGKLQELEHQNELVKAYDQELL